MDPQPINNDVVARVVPSLSFGQIVGPSAMAGRNAQCPCGSGKKFKKCCLPRQNESYQRDPQRLPKPRGVRGSRANLIVADDVMVEVAAESPTPPAGKNATAMAMLRAKVSERIVWAYLETGFFITEANKLAHLPDRVAKWEQALVDYDNATPAERAIMLAPATE